MERLLFILLFTFILNCDVTDSNEKVNIESYVRFKINGEQIELKCSKIEEALWRPYCLFTDKDSSNMPLSYTPAQYFVRADQDTNFYGTNKSFFFGLVYEEKKTYLTIKYEKHFEVINDTITFSKDSIPFELDIIEIDEQLNFSCNDTIYADSTDDYITDLDMSVTRVEKFGVGRSTDTVILADVYINTNAGVVAY